MQKLLNKMSSSIQFASPPPSKPRTASIYTRPLKKQKMSITQTYSLAHSARGKLSKEAARADHDLRLLVGHANLLDSLMLDLASAEREQGQWFTRSLSQSDEAVEEPEADWEADDVEDSESDTDSDSDDFEAVTIPSQPEIITAAVRVGEDGKQQEDFSDDNEEEDYDDLTLTRVTSRHEYPPDLSADSGSDSEDEQMPPSPPAASSNILADQSRQSTTTPTKVPPLSEAQQKAFIEDGFFLAPRPQQTSKSHLTVIAAF